MAGGLRAGVSAFSLNVQPSRYLKCFILVSHFLVIYVAVSLVVNQKIPAVAGACLVVFFLVSLNYYHSKFNNRFKLYRKVDDRWDIDRGGGEVIFDMSLASYYSGYWMVILTLTSPPGRSKTKVIVPRDAVDLEMYSMLKSSLKVSGLPG